VKELKNMGAEHKIGQLVYEPLAGLGTIVSIDKTTYYPYEVHWASGDGIAVYDEYDIQRLKSNLEQQLLIERMKGWNTR
jgi:hypothetical protein